MRTGTDEAGGATARPSRRLLRTAVGALSAVLLVVMLAITSVDVIGRYFFNAPLRGAFEISEVAMALLIFAGLPLVCLERGHVSMTMLTEYLGPRGRRIQAVATNLVSAVVLGVLAWQLWKLATRLLGYGDATLFLGIPLGPVAILMGALAGLSGLLLLVNAVAAARQRASE